MNSCMKGGTTPFNDIDMDGPPHHMGSQQRSLMVLNCIDSLVAVNTASPWCNFTAEVYTYHGWEQMRRQHFIHDIDDIPHSNQAHGFCCRTEWIPELAQHLFPITAST